MLAMVGGLIEDMYSRKTHYLNTLGPGGMWISIYVNTHRKFIV